MKHDPLKAIKMQTFSIKEYLNTPSIQKKIKAKNKASKLNPITSYGEHLTGFTLYIILNKKQGGGAMIEKGWALKRNEKGDGVFHRSFLGIKIPESVYLKLKEEANRAGMKASTFAKILLELGLELWEKQKEASLKH
jgi:hypothetical protein